MIKDSILLLLCLGLSREFSGLKQTSVTMSTTRPVLRERLPYLLHPLLACFLLSLCPPVFPFLIVCLCLLFSSWFRKLFYLSFTPFILSSDPQHLSLFLSLCVCLCSFHSSNQVYCDAIYDKPTDKNLPMQKTSFASAGCFGTFVHQFFRCVCVYIVYLKKKPLSNSMSVFCFGLKDKEKLLT